MAGTAGQVMVGIALFTVSTFTLDIGLRDANSLSYCRFVSDTRGPFVICSLLSTLRPRRAAPSIAIARVFHCSSDRGGFRSHHECVPIVNCAPRIVLLRSGRHLQDRNCTLRTLLCAHSLLWEELDLEAAGEIGLRTSEQGSIPVLILPHHRKFDVRTQQPGVVRRDIILVAASED
jgi:hypothetical protein